MVRDHRPGRRGGQHLAGNLVDPTRRGRTGGRTTTTAPAGRGHRRHPPRRGHAAGRRPHRRRPPVGSAGHRHVRLRPHPRHRLEPTGHLGRAPSHPRRCGPGPDAPVPAHRGRPPGRQTHRTRPVRFPSPPGTGRAGSANHGRPRVHPATGTAAASPRCDRSRPPRFPSNRPSRLRFAVGPRRRGGPATGNPRRTAGCTAGISHQCMTVFHRSRSPAVDHAEAPTPTRRPAAPATGDTALAGWPCHAPVRGGHHFIGLVPPVGAVMGIVRRNAVDSDGPFWYRARRRSRAVLMGVAAGYPPAGRKPQATHRRWVSACRPYSRLCLFTPAAITAVRRRRSHTGVLTTVALGAVGIVADWQHRPSGLPTDKAGGQRLSWWPETTCLIPLARSLRSEHTGGTKAMRLA